MKHVRKTALAASAFTCAALLSFGWSEQGGISLSIESAQARVGRPMTPASAAGVARRHNRRAVYGAGAVGAGAAAAGTAAAIGTAGAVAATSPNWGWGGNPYQTGTGYYAGGPYYGGNVLGATLIEPNLRHWVNAVIEWITTLFHTKTTMQLCIGATEYCRGGVD